MFYANCVIQGQFILQENYRKMTISYIIPLQNSLVKQTIWEPQHDSVISKTVFLFVCFDSLCASQQFFSHVRTGLPGFNNY